MRAHAHVSPLPQIILSFVWLLGVFFHMQVMSLHDWVLCIYCFILRAYIYLYMFSYLLFVPNWFWKLPLLIQALRLVEWHNTRWYANIYHTHSKQKILCLQDQTVMLSVNVRKKHKGKNSSQLTDMLPHQSAVLVDGNVTWSHHK